MSAERLERGAAGQSCSACSGPRPGLGRGCRRSCLACARSWTTSSPGRRRTPRSVRRSSPTSRRRWRARASSRRPRLVRALALRIELRAAPRGIGLWRVLSGCRSTSCWTSWRGTRPFRGAGPAAALGDGGGGGARGDGGARLARLVGRSRAASPRRPRRCARARCGSREEDAEALDGVPRRSDPTPTSDAPAEMRDFRLGRTLDRAADVPLSIAEAACDVALLAAHIAEPCAATSAPTRRRPRSSRTAPLAPRRTSSR